MELANTHAALGNADEAFSHLLQALEDGDPSALAIRSDPAWDGLRRDPRYREAIRQVRTMRFSPTRGRDGQHGRQQDPGV
jgi:hypothetical protein